MLAFPFRFHVPKNNVHGFVVEYSEILERHEWGPENFVELLADSPKQPQRNHE